MVMLMVPFAQRRKSVHGHVGKRSQILGLRPNIVSRNGDELHAD